MIPEQLVRETFEDLVEKYDFKIDFISKMKFNLWTLDDVPFELKQDIMNRVQVISNCIGRKRFQVDNPRVYKKDDVIKIVGGIWSIRIF